MPPGDDVANEGPAADRIPFAELLQLLEDPSTAPRMADLERLSGLEGSRLTQFRSSWPRVPVERRRRLIEDMSGLAEDNVELDYAMAFRFCLSDPDDAVRASAAAGLWEDAEPATALALANLLTKDESSLVRAEAAGSLAGFAYRIETGVVSPTLARKVRDALLTALESTVEPVSVRRRALESAGFLSDDSVISAIGEAYNGNDDQLRLSSVRAMGRNAASRWLDTVVKELGSDDPEMRFEAVRAAGELADESALREVVSLLSDDDHEVRLAAIGAVGQIGGDQAVEALRFLIKNTEEEDVREAASDALEEAQAMGDPLKIWEN